MEKMNIRCDFCLNVLPTSIKIINGSAAILYIGATMHYLGRDLILCNDCMEKYFGYTTTLAEGEATNVEKEVTKI